MNKPSEKQRTARQINFILMLFTTLARMLDKNGQENLAGKVYDLRAIYKQRMGRLHGN